MVGVVKGTGSAVTKFKVCLCREIVFLVFLIMILCHRSAIESVLAAWLIPVESAIIVEKVSSNTVLKGTLPPTIHW
jgi:hypothetical protein